MGEHHGSSTARQSSPGDARPHFSTASGEPEALAEGGHVRRLRGRFEYRPPGHETGLEWSALGTWSPVLARAWLLGKRQTAQVWGDRFAVCKTLMA
jgi:hypothetical protein